MDRFPTRTLRSPVLAAAAAFLVLAAGGCSSTHHRTLRPGVSGGSGLDTSTTAAGAVTTETSTTVGGPSTTTRSSATTQANRPSGTLPLNTGSSPSNAAPSPATPGTYTMDQSGGITGYYSEPPQGTLVVDPAQTNGIQVSHRHVDQSNPPADTTTQYLSSGPVILSTTEGAGPQGISCTFNPPIAAPPWPPAAGKTFSARGDCGNGNTVTVQGRIAGSQTATLKDGETFTVWVVNSTVTISGQINGSGTQVDWYSPALRLPVHEQTDVQGSSGVFHFTLHSVSDLVSSRPT